MTLPPDSQPGDAYAWATLHFHRGGANIMWHGEGFETSPAPNQSDRVRIVMAAPQIRPIRIEGNVAYITLTKGYVAVIDAADVHLVDKWNWTAKVMKTNVYAKRNNCSSKPHRVAYMHRAIMGEPEGLEVDHRDQDGLNNRRANLRAATRRQNSTNVRLRASNTSGYKGACWDKKKSCWVAHIRVDGVQTYLGRFETAEDAHKAYAEASVKLHGEFGKVA